MHVYMRLRVYICMSVIIWRGMKTEWMKRERVLKLVKWASPQWMEHIWPKRHPDAHQFGKVIVAGWQWLEHIWPKRHPDAHQFSKETVNDEKEYTFHEVWSTRWSHMRHQFPKVIVYNSEFTKLNGHVHEHSWCLDHRMIGNCGWECEFVDPSTQLWGSRDFAEIVVLQWLQM